MKLKITTLSAAIAAAVGTAGALAPTVASSGIVPDGHYRMVINDTPFSSGTFNIGTDGNWNSSFTFGCLPATKGCSSQAMYDKDLSYNGRGSSILGDGVSGVLDITVSGNNYTINSFNKDVISFTAGGDFLQYLDTQLPTPPGSPVGTSLMTGTIIGSAMTLTPTGRLGAVNSPLLLDRKWLVDDAPTPGSNTAWSSFSTATATNPKGTINGKPLANAGDISGSAPSGLGFTADGRADFTVTLVTGGIIGSDWGGFFGAQFFEIWNSTIYSLIKANNDTTTTNAGVAKPVNLIANDTTPFPPLAVASVAAVGTNGGTIVNNGNGTVTYTPPVGPTPPFTDTFTYTISDADPGPNPRTDTATVTISVNAANAPIAADDTATTTQNASVDVDVTINDTTPTGTIDKTTVVITTPAANGGTSVNPTTGVVTYTPTTGFAGTDTFGYTVNSSVPVTTNEGIVTVAVEAAALSSAGTTTPGPLALAAASTSSRITAAAVPADPGAAIQCLGGCFDFVISGLAPGSQVNAFLPPLTQPIPAADPNAPLTYRKLQGSSWVNFDLSLVASGALNAFGACSNSVGDYTPGLNAGDECLMLTLTDGSLAGGDADGVANGSIADPGGIGSIAPASTGATSPSRSDFNSSGGCAIGKEPASISDKGEWWLIAGFLGLLGWMRRGRTVV